MSGPTPDNSQPLVAPLKTVLQSNCKSRVPFGGSTECYGAASEVRQYFFKQPGYGRAILTEVKVFILIKHLSIAIKHSFNTSSGADMKKIIAGLIAVICVHIGFSMLVSTEPAADQTAAAVRQISESEVLPASPFADVNEVPEPRPELAANDPARAPRPVRIVERIVYVPVPRSVNAGDRRPESAGSRDQSSTVAMFEPVVITPRSIPLSADFGEKRSINADVPTKPVKSEKRSLLAKALPIIKKPWDLMKFVGSRLK